MKTFFGSLVIIALLICTSCKNEECHNPCIDCLLVDEPGAYFPGYPGTWWKYVDQHDSLITFYMSPTYELCYNICRPTFTNADKCLSGNGLMQFAYHGLGRTGTYNSPIYSLTLDSVLICPISFVTFGDSPTILHAEEIDYRRMTTNLDTILVVNDVEYSDVIEVYEYHINNANHRYLDYFAKSIGLIKRDHISSTDAKIQILCLTDYAIGSRN
jgi:hypothetical protein